MSTRIVSLNGPRGTMKILLMTLKRKCSRKKRDRHNIQIASRAVCKSAADHLLSTYREGDTGVGPACTDLLRGISLHQEVAYAPNSAVYPSRQGSHAKQNELAYILAVNNLDDCTAALFPCVMVGVLAEAVTTEVWNRAIKEGLALLEDIVTYMEAKDSGSEPLRVN